MATMSAPALAAIGTGAALGAWLRYALGLWLNPLLASLPLGTLAANLLGAYAIGLALGVFAQIPALPAELRLFVITGFLGALTTFSTFSAEVVTLLGRQAWGWAALTAGGHLLGSLALTALGLATVAWLRT